MKPNDEQPKAAADAEHVARCKDEAAKAIYDHTPVGGVDSVSVIDLIASGRVPHVRMDYGGAA